MRTPSGPPFQPAIGNRCGTELRRIRSLDFPGSFTEPTLIGWEARLVWSSNNRKRESTISEWWRERTAELLDPLYRLTILCQQAVSRRTDVVLLSI